jgi:hypothetical protein
VNLRGFSFTKSQKRIENRSEEKKKPVVPTRSPPRVPLPAMSDSVSPEEFKTGVSSNPRFVSEGMSETPHHL